jgi:uncharacterized protein
MKVDAIKLPRFLVDQNIGKLARRLRLLGYDAVFFNGEDDNQMVKQALAENRIILTRDTAIRLRKVAVSGLLMVITFKSEDADVQMRELLARLPLIETSHPFTRCLEDNSLLYPVEKPRVEDRVPEYTFKTQEDSWSARYAAGFTGGEHTGKTWDGDSSPSALINLIILSPDGSFCIFGFECFGFRNSNFGFFRLIDQH